MITLKVNGLTDTLKMFKNFHTVNPRAISLAMNHSARVAETASLKKMRDNWNIRARDLKPYVGSKRATVGDLSYVFKFHSTPINLHEFYAEQEDTGVAYKLQKRKKRLGSAFIKGSGRNRFVLKRVGKERYPLRPYFTITPSWMFHEEGGEQVFINTFLNGSGKRGVGGSGGGFNKRYLHELNRLLKK